MAESYPEARIGVQSSTIGALSEAQRIRQRRMAALALADEMTLEAEATKIFASISYTFLRHPEAGLIMLEGRAGNSGQRFNLGEMLITRCVVRLEAQDSEAITEGYAFIQGNRPRHAELAAVFDALLQLKDWAESLDRLLIEPLLAGREKQLQRRADETVRTKVDFFTLVRGEDE